MERWLAVRRETLERIALRGTWLDQEDVSRLLRLSLPGIDELAALFEIARLARTGRYDLVVVDTAPTGHTLRMLNMPGTLREIARVFDAMQAKHRVMVEALRGAWTPDAEEALIDGIDRDGQDLAALLRDPARVRVVVGDAARADGGRGNRGRRRGPSRQPAFPCTTSSSTGSRRNPIARADGAMRGARWSGAPSAN